MWLLLLLLSFCLYVVLDRGKYVCLVFFISSSREYFLFVLRFYFGWGVENCIDREVVGDGW